MTWKPDLTVAAVVQEAGRFLIVEERIGAELVFNQPAGHVEDDESILAAVVRETREETAWLFTPEYLVGTYLWRNPCDGRSSLRFAFGGTVLDHRPLQSLDRGIVAARWLTRLELERMPARLRSPLVLRCIDDFLAGQQFGLASVACVTQARPELRTVGN
jgi:8-oxo-dGTP pyrophosphatase MutT (NUDIX family)